MKTTLLLLLLTALPTTSQSFAYAPNFITKIIQESSGIAPVGLADVAASTSATKRTDDDHPTTDATTAAITDVSEGGRVITTRFPPEPNGYLHLGHAKAVSFNFAVARSFRGKCHMRLDDTNPTKEDEEYVRSILKDVRWIQSGLEPFDNCDDNEEEEDDNTKKKREEDGPWCGTVKKTSDYFELIHDAAVMLIRNGEAYVDELTAEEMRDYRGSLTEGGKESPWRERGMDENLRLFREMREGKHPEGKYVLRAKIDMSSPNLNLRDPVLYRIKHESHQATGDDWCIYPMYDFSHPIADATEGITHSLCTLEFEDHRPLYDWVAERILEGQLVDCRPRQIEFSRLNLKYTVLSKRKLIKLVEEKYVTGWDDPRMPTLSGIRRRGVPPAAVRLFCERMGISKSDSNIDFGIMEDCTREVLDDVSPRAFAILEPLKVTLQNWDNDDNALEEFDVPRHPKREDLGDRTVPFGKSVYIERSDFFDVEGPEGAANNHKAPKGFKRLLPNEKVRLKYAYVIRCDEVVRDSTTNEPVELKCTYYPETRAGVTPEGEKRVAGIIQWVEASTAKTCTVMQYDRLFKTEEPGKETGNFIDDINPYSLKVMDCVVVEPSVAADAFESLQRIIDGNSSSGDSIDHSNLTYQFERSGYYALDTSSNGDNLVFNRVVTLRDTWAPKAEERPKKQQKKVGNKPKQQDNAVLEDARRVALRVGTIVEAGPHPEADSLIVCKLDCGDMDDSGIATEPRTVVAGLAGKIPFNNLIGRKIVCISNLKPAKMRGIESTAMLLAASDGREGDDETVELLDVPNSAPNGELIYFENMSPCEPDAMLKSKGALKVWDRVKAALKVGVDKEAIYQDDGADRRLMTSAGPVTVSSLSDCMIG